MIAAAFPVIPDLQLCLLECEHLPLAVLCRLDIHRVVNRFILKQYDRIVTQFMVSEILLISVILSKHIK